MTLNDIGNYLKPAGNPKNKKCSTSCSECRVLDNMHLLSLVQDLIDREVHKAVLRERRKHKVKS